MHNAIIVSSQASPVVQFTETIDIEHHADCPDGWNLRYDQLTPGRFEGSISQLRLDGVHLLRDQANQAMTKQGQAWDGAITFSLPLRMPDNSFHCLGHSVAGRNLLVARGDDLPELRAPENLDLLCIAVDESLLLHQLQHDGEPNALPPLPRYYSMVDAESHAELVGLCRTLLDDHSPMAQGLLSHDSIRTSIRDTVIAHLLALIGEREVHTLEPNARKRIVDRARDYALAHRDDPPSIVDLCDKVGASRRKLQYCFQETLGINPVAYLRALRLNAAHRALLQGDGSTSVQEIAASYGFWHLSRFASDYRQLFGERPSDTRKRNRYNCAEFG